MIITFAEMIDLVVMTLALGFIFKDYFGAPSYASYQNYDPLKPQKAARSNFWFAVLAVAPAIILHEFSHKFVAISLGIDAVFHAAYSFLGIGILLKLMNVGFIFFVPGYVTHSAALSAAQSTLIAFAGPGMNLLIWLFAALAIRQKWFNRKYTPLLMLTSKINILLFIFNMLPIPPFDGYHVVSGLYHVFF